MTETDPHIRVTVADGVMELIIDRPEKKNALTQGMYRAMTAALIEAQQSLEIGAVVLSGAGGVFTAGNDLKDFMAGGPVQGPAAAMDLLRHTATLDVPLVAAVDGLAIGIGTTILMHCDAVVAGPAARFKTPFIDLAVCPEGGSSLLFPIRLGRAATTRLLMLGDELLVEEAAAVGLVDRVVERPGAEAMTMAARLAAKPREAMRATKRLLREARGEAVLDTLDREADAFAERLGSAEAQAVIAAFFQRG